MNTAAFDATKEYCTRDIVSFWQPSSSFSQWTPSRFTVKIMSYSCGEQFFAAEKSRLFRDHHTLQHIMRVSDPRLHKHHGREVCNLDIAVWNASEKILCLLALTPSSPKLQSCNHISWTRETGFSRKLVLTTSFGASDTGLTMSLHASRAYGAA